jgi:hypothetical protein
MTDDPKGEEAWQFEQRVKIRAVIGIPYGRVPTDLIVAGPREQCEALRQQVAASGIPTERCEGPIRFLRK